MIKANSPSRLVFAVQSHVDSNVALGQSGAEALLGQGDGLWYPAGASQPERVQAPYLSGSDLEALLAPMRRAAETPAERVREGMFAKLPKFAPLEEVLVAPTPAEPVEIVPMPATEAWGDPRLDEALEAAYRKGRAHGETLAFSPPISNRVMIGSDWTLAVLLFLAGTIAGVIAQPALPLAAGVWLAVVVTRRRTSMDRYTRFAYDRLYS